MKRLVLCFLMLLILAGASVNSGTRHETAAALSETATAWYAENCDAETLFALPGSAAESSAEVWESPLCQALHTLMNETRTGLPSYHETRALFARTDASRGSTEPLLFYSDAFGTYDREQVWADARGNFYRDGAGRDLHHLRPADPELNLTRGSMSFGDVRSLSENWQTCFRQGEAVFWYDADWDYGRGLAEVRDEVKGDVARILLYVWVTYGGPEGENQNLWADLPPSGSGVELNRGQRVIESAQTLLDWCRQDPVDAWELGRNDVVQDIQGSRNVFIDYPELAFLLLDREIPDMPTPSGWAHSLYCTVSAAAEPPEGGSVTVSGLLVTAVPNEGWELGGWTLTPPESAAVTRTETGFLLSDLREDCLLTVLFTPEDPCAEGHAWDEGVLTVLPSQTAPGERSYTCTRCGATRTEEVPFRFDDVQNPAAYYFEPVYWALHHTPPITVGTDETHFSPKQLCTRAQIVAFLWRLAGEPEPEGESCPFADVPEDAWYRSAVLWAVEQGIAAGTDETAFSPKEPCTRAQIVTFLWRAAGRPEPEGESCPFEDVPETVYYRSAVLWAVENGIVYGVTPTTFCPNESCTRAEAVAFLWRVSQSHR